MNKHENNFIGKINSVNINELNEILDGKLVINNDSDNTILSMDPIEQAKQGSACVLQNSKYDKYLKDTKATIVILNENNASLAPNNLNLFICDNPHMQWATLSQYMYPDVDKFSSTVGIDDSAKVHSSANIGDNVTIDAFCCLEEGCQIGNNVTIGAGSYIGKHVIIGDNTIIEPQVRISHTHMGSNCFIQSGAKIGQAGFGFAVSMYGHKSVQQIGKVIIGDFVHIGANSTIDRGAVRDTIIESHVRVDNLVHLAHNVHVKAGAVIVAQVGIAGSTTIGMGAMIGGQVAIAGHLNIGDMAQVTAKSGVSKNIPAGESWASSVPAEPVQSHWKKQAILRRIIKEHMNKE